MRKFRYELTGIDGGGNAFTVVGELQEGPTLSSFAAAPGAAMSDAYLRMTGGKAEYGKPGQGGCRGPYNFQKLTVEVVD